MAMNTKLLFMLFFTIVGIGLVHAANPSFGYFKRDFPAELRQECFINGSICDACNITSISFPINSSKAITNAVMTQNANDFNFTFVNTSVDGRYDVRGYCTFGDDVKKPWVAYLIVNYAGQPLSTAQGIVYLIVLILSFGIFLLCLYGALTIPWEHKKNDEGQVIGVNDLRYFKVAMWVFTYVLLLWISFLAMGVSRNFLALDGAERLFYFMFRFLLAGMFPTIVVSAIILLVNFVTGKKLTKALARGLPMR
jgi:hypothetical protein